MKFKKHLLFILMSITLITIILVPVLLIVINNSKSKSNPTDIVVNKSNFQKKDISMWTQNPHYTSLSKSKLKQLSIL